MPDDPKFAVIAETAYDYVGKYAALAKELKINIVPGTIVTKGPNSPARNGASNSTPKKPTLLNIAPFISFNGEVLGSYTKTNLWHPERPHLTSQPQSQAHIDPQSSRSPLHTVIETPLGLVGLLICWDLGFPEAFRSLIRQGAKIIIIPTFWTAFDLSEEGLKYNKDAELLFLKSTMVARAFENTCCIIFCNAGGPKEEGYAGLSQVAMPIVGMVEGSHEDGIAGMKIVEVDMNILEIAEKNYKVREDLAREDWHYGYRHGGS